ncbi:MAG: hypothetical protein QOI00_556 [Chloroflexota bacterium]|nr:hypothetical protein [Chloroflexota bacterium]
MIAAPPHQAVGTNAARVGRIDDTVETSAA